ncbi:type IV secretion system DNA-binding domain-containing protein [Halogranum rubrum]|uniref:Conjugation protein n=1 Tax=Halogranum salarium B-1 TaxID=1210908 RepID=J2Z9K2_9EURY|nr:type IV secretion system DNA-binding domain-containing protein [Halogranum salarium]EJN57315.1 conjugation protein [Halogranum salarium B-1]
MTREYIRVTPTSETLPTTQIPTALESLHKLTAEESSFTQRLNPLHSTTPPTFEFLVLSKGVDEPVEFYYGADRHLDTLEERLTRIYPSSFDLSRESFDVESKLVAEDTTREDLSPRGVRWQGSSMRKDDWMMLLTRNEPESFADETLSLPLVSLVDELADVEAPTVFQVLFQRKPDWSPTAEGRKLDLRNQTDTLMDKAVDAVFTDTRTLAEKEQHLSDGATQRLEELSAKNPRRTFTVNLRAVAVPTVDIDEQPVDAQLDDLMTVFDSIGGEFYEVERERLRANRHRESSKRKHALAVFDQLLDRELVTGRGRTTPDFVCNSRELAPFITIPSGNSLSVEGSRRTRSEQESRSSLPLPHHDHMESLREGMAIGHAVDENGTPEDEPVCIPTSSLVTHYLRAATTGGGKSKALLNDILSASANTDGPVIVLDHKGDGLAENYMRAHGRRFGMDDLEENVLHFTVPDILPGFSFFDLRPDLSRGVRRTDAVKRKADQYKQILELVMGKDLFRRAATSPILIESLIKALFDEEYGRENGTYRESEDYFGHEQLENASDQLAAAGPPEPNEAALPKTTDVAARRELRRKVNTDAKTFSTILTGLNNRLAYVSQDANLRRIFNNTAQQLDFNEILDSNQVVFFDLGGLSDEAAKLLTGLILAMLEDALRTHEDDLTRRDDEYVVNLMIDEAASVAASDVLNNMLEKGRSFRLSVGLAMQFPEQMQAEGGRRLYLNLLNNIGTLLVGKINVDRELANAMAHEELDPEAFANRIRSLPRGEWIAQLPSPTFGETGPYPFNVKPLPIPGGHPESESPLTGVEEQRFQDALEHVHERTQQEFGVPRDTSQPTATTPDELGELLDVHTDDLDVAIAKTVRSVQLRKGVREDNEWVSVETVDETLRELYERVDTEPPAYEELTEIRKRSRLLDTTVDIDADELIVKLTDAGETEAEPDTGDVRSAGGSDHDDALLEIEQALSPLGFTVSILTQDGSEQPDARATHPDIETPLAIEAETTTPKNPAKVLTNLQKAQAESAVPLFVVRPGETETYWAERLDRVLSSPVRELANGETRFYTHDVPLTFNGGATELGGVTAVRPVSESDDLRRSVWVKNKNEIALRDGSGTEHLRVSTWDEVTKDRVPATYSYDRPVEEYLVYERGEIHAYESKDAFEAEWVKISKPFIPAEELTNPTYGTDSYAVVILREDDEPVVYDRGSMKPLETLLETSSVSKPNPQTASKGSESVSFPNLEAGWRDDPNIVAGQFAKECLVVDEGNEVKSAAVYERYKTWAENHSATADSRSWFGRRLSNQIEFERETKHPDGESTVYYLGIALQDSEGTR